MVFVYIRIYFAAKARARRGIRKPPRRQPQDAVTSFTNISHTGGGEVKNGSDVVAPAGGSVDRNSNTSPRDGDRQIATIESHPRPMPIPTVTCDLASDISTSDAGDVTVEASEQKDTLKVYTRTLFTQISCKIHTYIVEIAGNGRFLRDILDFVSFSFDET